MTTTNPIESAIASAIFKGQDEKTFIDKLLSKEDILRLKDLVKKNELSREEILELLYMLTSTESKLVNYSLWDRYVILKYFVWIRDFIKVAEEFYDYKEHLEELNKKDKQKLTETTNQLLNQTRKLIEHNTKFLVDLYLNIARTTLSIGATGFMEILKQKFEIDYKNPMAVGQTPEKKGFFSRLVGG